MGGVAFDDGARVFADGRGSVTIHAARSVDLGEVKQASKRIGKEIKWKEKKRERVL